MKTKINSAVLFRKKNFILLCCIGSHCQRSKYTTSLLSHIYIIRFNVHARWVCVVSKSYFTGMIHVFTTVQWIWWRFLHWNILHTFLHLFAPEVSSLDLTLNKAIKCCPGVSLAGRGTKCALSLGWTLNWMSRFQALVGGPSQRILGKSSPASWTHYKFLHIQSIILCLNKALFGIVTPPQW